MWCTWSWEWNGHEFIQKFKENLPINPWSWGNKLRLHGQILTFISTHILTLSRDQKMLRLREKRSKHWQISKLSIKISLYKLQNFHSGCIFTRQIYGIAMVHWILYSYSEDRCVCMWMYKCLREMITGDFFFSFSPSAITVQMRKTFMGAFAILLTVKYCSKLHLSQNWFCNTKQWSLHNFPWQIIRVCLPWEFWGEISNEINTMLVLRLWYLDLVFMWERVVNVFARDDLCHVRFWLPLALLRLRIKPLHKFYKISGKAC